MSIGSVVIPPFFFTFGVVIFVFFPVIIYSLSFFLWKRVLLEVCQFY